MQPREEQAASESSRPADGYFRLHLEAMATGDFDKRQTAGLGLIACGRQSLPYLTRMLASGDARSREDAAAVMAGLGEQAGDVVGLLLAALRAETDVDVQDGIVVALGALKSDAAIPALIDLITSPETDSVTRECATYSLEKIPAGSPTS